MRAQYKGIGEGAPRPASDLAPWAEWLLRECEAAAFENFAARCPHRVANERGAAICDLRDSAPCDPSSCPRHRELRGV